MKYQMDHMNYDIDRLLAVLDKDSEHLQSNIDLLNELRRLLVRHDVNALGKLLTTLQDRARDVRQHTAERNHLRQKLAAALDCGPEEITLSRLEKHPAVVKQRALTQRKTTLRQLTFRLKSEFVSTQTLLADCARFNRMLLNCLFENPQAHHTTYKPTGTKERMTAPVWMNMQV